MVLQTIELISPRFHQIADTQSSGTDDREKLDPMVDDGVAKKFVVRTEMISCIRSFLNTKGNFFGSLHVYSYLIVVTYKNAL